MLFTTLVVITVLCLALPLTRIYGFKGSVITLYFYTYPTLTLPGVMALGTVAYFYFNHRRKSYA